MATELELIHHDLVFEDRVTRVALDNAIKNFCEEAKAPRLSSVRSSSILFDFSKCWFIDLDAAHWLLNVIRSLRQAANSISLRLPDVETAEESNVWSFLIRWRFFDILSKVAGPATDFLSEEQAPLVFDAPKYREAQRIDPFGRKLPLLTNRLLAIAGTFIDRTLPFEPQLDAFVRPYRDVLLLQALAQSCKVGHDDAGSLMSFIAEEGATNAIIHAEGDYTLSSMQIVDPGLARTLDCPPHLKIVISDNGMGIPEVMRRAAAQGRISTRDLPEDHVELIELFASKALSVDSAIIAAAVGPGVTSNPRSGGLGLHHLVRYASDLRADVLIRSGYASVLFVDGVVARQYNKFAESLGTLITITIPSD